MAGFLGRLFNKDKMARIEKTYLFIVAIFVGYILADLSILYFRPEMLPAQAPPTSTQSQSPMPFSPPSAYQIIAERNIFDSDGKIPPPLSAEEGEKLDMDGPAVPSRLPLTLIGTIVHYDPSRSVASIQLRNKNKIESFKLDESIDGMATVTKIERRKVTFRSNSGRLEYIEIKEDAPLTLGVRSSAPSSGEEIRQKSDNEVVVKRSAIEKYTKNLPALLNQAAAVPNFVPGSGKREIDGYKILNIAPNSIFEKLGIQRQDIIKTVNGDPVTSPAKAMEFYNQFKSASNVEIGLERNGRMVNMKYSVSD